uniref:PiggyBac transposable element-derived protein 3 n=1 Tax=Bactrocera latifrons TaxID=174628 RepID=A0A0K8VYQ3_BACLA
MGYHQLPSYRRISEDMAVPVVSKAMSRNRFDLILRFMHVNDNSKIPKNNKDRLFKIRPMVEALNQRFQQVYHRTKELSVDESMILFKGRTAIKQYCPMKPIKRGYKLWCLADQRGYIKKLLYTKERMKLSKKNTKDMVSVRSSFISHRRGMGQEQVRVL